MRSLVSLMLVGFTLALFAGCSDDSNTASIATSQPSTTAAATNVSTKSPLETPPASARRTGIASVDAAIDAVLAHDVPAIRALIRYTPIGCIVESQGIGAPPFCRDGELAGTLVDALPVAQCEGFFVRPDGINELTIPTDGASLYAVYRRDPAGGFPPGSIVVVFESPPQGGDSEGQWGWALTMTDAGITGIHVGCGQTVEQFVEFNRLTDEIVPRQGTPEP